MNWMRVEDKLPDAGIHVFLHWEDDIGSVDIGYLSEYEHEDGGNIWFIGSTYNMQMMEGSSEPTHWMHLPDGPKKRGVQLPSMPERINAITHSFPQPPGNEEGVWAARDTFPGTQYVRADLVEEKANERANEIVGEIEAGENI